MDDLVIRSRREGTTGIVDLTGEARLERIASLRGAARTLREGGAKSLLLGLTGLSFADSASVGAFLEVQRECAAAGGKLVLFGLPPRLQRQIGDMGLAGRFATAPDEAGARALVK